MLSIFGAAQDSIDPNVSASNKIKLANRQKTLSEIVSNSLCYVYLDVNPEENLLRAAQASALFSETLDALQNGSVQKSVRKAEDPKIIAELSAVDAVWRPMKNTINRILTTRQPTHTELQEISELGAAVLETTLSAAQLIEAYHAKGDLGADRTTTLRFVSDQLMRSQKATKEFCFVLADVSPSKNQDALAQTRSDYFEGIVWLYFGSEERNILPPTTYELDFLYDELFGAWFVFEDLVERTLEDGAASTDTLAFALEVSDVLSDTSEKALTMY